jgi:uncharacterized membrane protein YdbT with pleckstrin-like domain
MRYIDDTLVASERVLLRAYRHWVELVVPMLFASAVMIVSLFLIFDVSIGGGVACLVLAGTIAAVAYVRWKSTEIAITNKRVMIKVGIVSVSSLEIYLKKIESTGIEQGFLGGLLNYGDILIRGTGGTDEILANIARPMQFRAELQKQLDITQAEVSIAEKQV